MANRYSFDESLKKDIQSNQRDKTKLGLLLIDLDHFKFVNDNYGHDVGDLLLIGVVERIKNCLRDNELFARLGGDEFAITLSGLSSIDAANIVALRILKAFSEPFEIEGHSIQSSSSIGISICPCDSADAKELFKYADIAMYRAKSIGRNQFSFFEEEMQDQFLAHFLMENQLRTAIANNDFYLHYQPVIGGINRELTGVEVLIRWCVDEQLISPDTFIPVAEKARLINIIGKWAVSYTHLTLPTIYSV